jgi:transposase
MKHVGVDLGSSQSAICIVNESGDIELERTIVTAECERLFAKLDSSIVVMESCAESRKVALLAQSYGHDVRVVPTSVVRALGVGARRIKTDKRDARNLAEASFRMGDKLPTVHVRSDEIAGLQDLLNARRQLIQSRTASINFVRSWLRKQLLGRPRCTPKTLGERVRELLRSKGVELHPAIAAHLAVVDAINAQVDSLDLRIREQAKSREETKRLMEISGVGPIVALAFLIRESSRELCWIEPRREHDGRKGPPNRRHCSGAEAATSTTRPSCALEDELTSLRSDGVLGATAREQRQEAQGRRLRSRPQARSRYVGDVARRLTLRPAQDNAAQFGAGAGRRRELHHCVNAADHHHRPIFLPPLHHQDFCSTRSVSATVARAVNTASPMSLELVESNASLPCRSRNPSCGTPRIVDCNDGALALDLGSSQQLRRRTEGPGAWRRLSLQSRPPHSRTRTRTRTRTGRIVSNLRGRCRKRCGNRFPICARCAAKRLE